MKRLFSKLKIQGVLIKDLNNEVFELQQDIYKLRFENLKLKKQLKEYQILLSGGLKWKKKKQDGVMDVEKQKN